MAGYIDIYDRMKVDIPVGELDGIKVSRFEVISPDDWTEEHEKRKDVARPLEMVRMAMDGRAPKPGWYTRLSEDGVGVWMSDTTAERRDHAEPVMQMSSTRPERVLINGLGIGMVLSAALSFDSVKYVDVVERDKRVIDLIGPHYLKDPRVTIHHGDAVEQMKLWPNDARWDVGWSDIWQDINPENLPQMAEFTEFYGKRCGFHGNWSEWQCKRMVWDSRSWADDEDDAPFMEFLTDEDRESFEADDEWDEEDEDE